MKNRIKILLVVVLLTTVLNIDVKEPKVVQAFDDVGICNQITANSGHNDRCGEGQITFVNNSFEEPRMSGSFSNVNAKNMPGWETTNSRNLIELWSSSFAVSYTGTGCQDGNQCVEINATEPAALYQDFEVKPGQFVYYSFYHMGRRSGGETLELRIGKPNNESGNKLNPTTGGIDDKVLESTVEKGIWTHRFGIYQVPEDFASDGSTTIRIAFLSTTSSSLGNLIDNIEFYTIAVYDNEISISEPVGGAVDPATDVFNVSNTLKYFDRDVFSTEQSSVTYTLSPDIEYVHGSMVVEGAAHSDVAVNGNEIVVTNLPELHEDIDITYNVKLNSSPNVARLQISSYFEYASNLVVDNYPTSYEMYNVKDTSSLNVSYNTEGYCDGITANNGYSDDCGIATNTVYNNDITLTDNNPTSALKDKTFTITNDLTNLNLDKDLDEATSNVVYDYNKNMKIDFSTLKINDVLHTDYTNTQGAGGAKLVLNNLPDYGIDDYKITFNATYDFSAPALRDIFVKEFLIASTLNYKNDSGDSYVSDKDQMNLSYATTMNITGTLTDDSSNSLLAPGEGLSGKATVTNSSPIAVNNVVVNLISDMAKLNATLTDVVVKRGSDVLVLDTDYTISGSKITFPKFNAGEIITIDYKLSSKTDFTNSTELRNTISVVSDEYTDGKYFLQRMNIDILAGTKVEVTSTVTDNKNDIAGNNETLTYTLKVKNVGSFDVKSLELNNLINSSLLKTTGVTITAKDNNSANISSSLIQYTNNKLVVNKAFSKNETIEITIKVPTVAVVSGTTLDNVFNVIAVATNNTKDPVVSSTASIPVSQRPVITVDNFVVINVGDSFNLSSYASATDNEDSDISSKMLYSPAIDSSKPTVQQISEYFGLCWMSILGHVG